MVTQRVLFGELNKVSEISLTGKLTKNAESIPLGVFSFFPSLSCGLRHATPRRRCLCFVAVPFGVRKGPFRPARFGAKLSESLPGRGRRVNRPFPFGVLVYNCVTEKRLPRSATERQITSRVHSVDSIVIAATGVDPSIERVDQAQTVRQST